MQIHMIRGGSKFFNYLDIPHLTVNDETGGRLILPTRWHAEAYLEVRRVCGLATEEDAELALAIHEMKLLPHLLGLFERILRVPIELPPPPKLPHWSLPYVETKDEGLRAIERLVQSDALTPQQGLWMAQLFLGKQGKKLPNHVGLSPYEQMPFILDERHPCRSAPRR